MTRVTPHERRALRAQGWWLCRGALTRRAVEELRRAIDACRAALLPSTQVLYTHDDAPADRPGMGALMEQWLNPHRRVGHEGIIEQLGVVRALVTELLNAEPVLFQDVFLVKRPEHAPFPWHQDFPYWPVREPRGLVTWVALDDVNEHNGCLVVATASHRAGLGASIDLHTGRSQAGAPGSSRPEIVPTQIEAEAGDVVVFHPLLWHGSGANQSSRSRRAWSASWLHPRARWSPARAPRHPLAASLREGARVSELAR